MSLDRADRLGFDPDRLNRIATWQQDYVDARKYPGSSVLIRCHGEEVWFSAAGKRNIEADLPFERDTTARIYSMTKPVVSVALMMLVERGLFPLETPVSNFIPAFADSRALIAGATRIDQTEPVPVPTLHHLLTHTSGLSYHFNPGLVAEAMVDRGLTLRPTDGTLAEVIDRLAELPLAFAPGQRWEYSIGIDVIGRVIEVATGQSLANFVRSEITEPLGMNHSGFRVPDGIGDRFAALYTPLAGDAMAINEKAGREADTLRLVEAPGTSLWHKTTFFSGGGGLVSTIDDYMAFVEMLRRGGDVAGARLIGPRTLDFMMRNHLPSDIAGMGPSSFAEQPMVGMGFGIGGAVVLDPARQRVPGSVGDFAWGGMASTYFWLDRAQDMSVVFFTQLSPSSSYPARSELKALVNAARLS